MTYLTAALPSTQLLLLEADVVVDEELVAAGFMFVGELAYKKHQVRANGVHELQHVRGVLTVAPCLFFVWSVSLSGAAETSGISESPGTADGTTRVKPCPHCISVEGGGLRVALGCFQQLTAGMDDFEQTVGGDGLANARAAARDGSFYCEFLQIHPIKLSITYASTAGISAMESLGSNPLIDLVTAARSSCLRVADS